MSYYVHPRVLCNYVVNVRSRVSLRRRVYGGESDIDVVCRRLRDVCRKLQTPYGDVHGKWCLPRERVCPPWLESTKNIIRLCRLVLRSLERKFTKNILGQAMMFFVGCGAHFIVEYRLHYVSEFTKNMPMCTALFFVFLAVKGCSGVFQAFLMAFERALILLVSLKRACFGTIEPVVRLPKCDSVWLRLPPLFFDVADGVVFHE